MGQPSGRDMLDNTLMGMAQGGMHDLIGGGFARYSVDRDWHVPHFEKMLTDNALLARTYLWAARLTGSAAYRRVGLDTLAFLRAELGRPDGTFAGSLDADSAGGEGAFYSWTPAEVAAAMGEGPAAQICVDLQITAAGSWQAGRSLPRRDDANDPAVTARLDAARPALLAARAGRPAPQRDDKGVVGWNGLAISAFASAVRAAGRSDCLPAADGRRGGLGRRLAPDGDVQASAGQSRQAAVTAAAHGAGRVQRTGSARG